MGTLNVLKLAHILDSLATARHRFFSDSLFRNATYLMASTAIMSVLGFVFWVFIAHLYSPSDIGVASALISVATLISYFSLLGLTSGIIRFLAHSKNQSGDINAAAIAIAGVTLVVAAFYAFMGTRLGGNNGLLEDTWHKLAFVLLMSAVSLNSLTDAVFIANRRGEYHTIGYATFGVFKLLLPLILIKFGALGIFGAYIIAMVASLAISYFLMRRGCNYRLLTKPDWALLKSMRRYTTHNYIGIVLITIPAQLMPQLIMKYLGAAAVAYFSMAWTMVNLLYIVPSAVTQSMLAESSFDARQKSEHLRRTVRLLATLLVPAVILAILVSPYMLAIFGQQYSRNGTHIFQILSLATFFVAISSIGNTILNIERRTWCIVLVQFMTMLGTGIAAFSLIRFGLPGVGLAFLIGDLVGVLVLGGIWLQTRIHGRTVAAPSDTAVRHILGRYGIIDFTSQPMQNGSHNFTFLISAGQSKYILRIYRPGVYHDGEIEQEIHFMDYLTLRNIPTPHVVTTRHGKKLGTYSHSGKNWQFLLMQFVEGNHPSLYSSELLKNMAGQQARLHVEGLLYARANPMHRRHESLPLRLRQGVLRALTPAGFSHFDYDASNILVSQEQILCVLDFEGMRFGPLVACIYFTLAQIYKQHADPTLIQDYLSTYEATRKLTRWEKLVLRVSLAWKCRSIALLGLRSS